MTQIRDSTEDVEGEMGADDSRNSIEVTMDINNSITNHSVAHYMVNSTLQ